MKRFDHFNARSTEEAEGLLEAYQGKAKLNAGGTDLLAALRDRSTPEYPDAIINIKTIDDLDFIEEDATGLSIGALTKLSAIARAPEVREHYGILSEAAHSVATPAIRNMATLGGNLAQDVRCWYYRYPDRLGGTITCLRKGGKVCDALGGDHRYHSVFGAAPLEEYACSSHCPAGTAIPAFLSCVNEGNYDRAAEILLDLNPLPAVTGRVCPIFCEPNCNRKAVDDAVAVRCIERFVGDYALSNAKRFYMAPGKRSGKSVAVVGSGPAGLAAAFYLTRMGHSVTVYERFAEPGGMLMYAIPAYRLPKDVVRKQVQALKEMGITFTTGVDVGKDTGISALAERFDAVLVAAGTWKEKLPGIKGEGLVRPGLELLTAINRGDRSIPGKKVAVVGGGNVAVDVARTLLRLGAKPVILYRRTRKEMPALQDEVERALQEGVKFRYLVLPVEVSKTARGLALTCSRMKTGVPDGSGRRSASPVAGSERTLHFDAIVTAVGEDADTSFLPSSGPAARLFTAGDFASGASTVIEAVTAGRRAATEIHACLRHAEPSTEAAGEQRAFVRPSFHTDPRVQTGELTVTERVTNIDVEDAQGLSAAEIQKESSRCCNCGCLAVNPSDIGVALVALDATVITNRRIIPAGEFFAATAIRSNLLELGEVITEVRIPRPAKGSMQAYSKFTVRKPVDFSIVSIACVVFFENALCAGARIVLGAVAPSPLRALVAEQFLKGKKIDVEVATRASEIALANARPFDGNAYKVRIARTLVRRALLGSTRSSHSTFGDNGGLIIDTSKAIPDESKPENVRALTEAVYEYGVH